MDLTQLVELYGLPGLIIGGLSWAYVTERSERKEQTRDRLAREREQSKELYEAIKTLDAFKALVERVAK